MSWGKVKAVVYVVLVLGLLQIGHSLFPSKDAFAASVLSDFRADNIISDENFTAYNSMSVTQIQNFFTSRNSVCLKNFKSLSLNDANKDGLGDEPYGKGTNEKVSAARLIWQAAQLYKISPKVILVTLEKEQGLITRQDCPQWRYNTALGYGCPDTAPCDNSAYGFTRQIDYGVWHFRGFFDDSYPVPPKVPGNQYIAYNPSSSCGGKTINIKNRATAALYSYTPYQPNSATLRAEPGTTVHCGAYGNSNFFYYYSVWFGPPVNEVVKTTIYSTTTDKTGKRASFGISLSRKPTSNVTIEYGITSPSTAAFIKTSKVTVTPATWNSPHLNVITVSGLNNTDQVGVVQYTVRANRPLSSDRRYSGISGDSVGHIQMINQDTSSTMPVYQLYSPAIDKHFYTANLNEKNAKVSEGFEDRGVGFYYCSAGDTTLHSIATTQKEQRLEIENSNQLNTLLKGGFSRISIAFAASSKGKVPIYRHYKSATGHSFYSKNASEATSQGYVSQGVVFYSCKQGDIPVYRLYKPATGTHFYTTSPNMRNDVLNNGGYRYEGVAYYISSTGTIPVYRLYKPSTGTHFYTISASERDKVAAEGGYSKEGIAYRIEPDGTMPVYRLYKPSTGRHYYTTSASDRDYVARNGGYIRQGVSMYISQ